jgi:hypothetical protein
MRLTIIICSLIVFFSGFSQNIDNQQKIKSSIQNYFYFDRENIHVQFNKKIYVNNEDLAFKGYVHSKDDSAPHLNTTNVQLIIYDESRQIVQKQLLYTTLGTFEGGLHLNEKFTSGKYYFQFYTNWMNNFKEDDSFVETIEIIDKSETYNLESNEPDWKTAKATFFPESNTIINGIVNRVGIKIIDCNHKGIAIDGEIIDSKSNKVTSFKTNTMGNGDFYFIPSAGETYSLKIHSGKVDLSEPLPKIQETGLVISYNNNLPNNILAVAIKTNNAGVDLYQNKKFTLLIHQDGNLIQKEFTFNNKDPEQILGFNKKYLSNGVSSIRLIDENLNEVTERLVYIYGVPKAITTLEAKTIANDSIVLTGKTEASQANISISVLPGNNACVGHKKSILGTFYLNAYLEKPESETFFYYDLENKTRKQDMELLMLNQNRSKYFWNDIMANPPKITFPFAKGVTISGKVEKKITPNSKNKILLISSKNSVFEETTIDKDNDFKFENFFAQDSTVFLLQMMNEKNITIYTKMAPRVTQTETPFRFGLNIENNNCPPLKNNIDSFTFINPNSAKNITNLEEVIIKGNYKKLLYKEEGNNAMATAYKIDDNEFGTVLNFISQHGYKTGINEEDQTVYIKSSRSAFSNDPPPTVYIDNVVDSDLNLLFTLSLTEVDEIYIDKSGFSNEVGAGRGTIKIYLKKGVKNDFYRTKLTSLVVTKGFAKNIEYKNSQFDTQKEFYYFGTLNWTPKIIIKDSPNYEVKFPKGNQTEIQVLIEGFSADGQLISEIKKVRVLKTI